MNDTQNDWKISPTEDSVRFERHFKFETLDAAENFVRSTGNYMSSPHMSVWIKLLAETNEAVATIQTADDPFTLVSAGMITSEVDGLYEEQVALPELATA